VLGRSRRNHARSAGTRTKQGNPYAPPPEAVIYFRPDPSARSERAIGCRSRARMVLATKVRRVPRSTAPHGFSVYTEKEQFASLGVQGPPTFASGASVPFVFVFALAAKARPSTASP
jgi:hypothetical protein